MARGDDVTALEAGPGPSAADGGGSVQSHAYGSSGRKAAP